MPLLLDRPAGRSDLTLLILSAAMRAVGSGVYVDAVDEHALGYVEGDSVDWLHYLRIGQVRTLVGSEGLVAEHARRRFRSRRIVNEVGVGKNGVAKYLLQFGAQRGHLDVRRCHAGA